MNDIVKIKAREIIKRINNGKAIIPIIVIKNLAIQTIKTKTLGLIII